MPSPSEANEGGAATTDSALAHTSARVESLLAELAETDPEVGARAEETIRLLLELYGAALGRIMALLCEPPGDEPAPLERMLDDQLVSGLLILHDLHPLDTEARVRRALDRIRPYLDTHAGDVEILHVTGEEVRLGLRGNCDGCPSSAVTVRGSIERVIAEEAPEIARIEVEGVAGAEPAETGFVPLETVRTRPPEHAMACAVPAEPGAPAERGRAHAEGTA